MFKTLPITHPLDLFIESSVSNPDFSIYSTQKSIFRPSELTNQISSTGIRNESDHSANQSENENNESRSVSAQKVLEDSKEKYLVATKKYGF